MLSTNDMNGASEMSQQQSPWFARPADLWSVVIVGAVAVVWNLIVLTRGVARLLPNREVDVTVLLSGVELDLPIGPGGTAVAAQVASADVPVSDLPVFVHALALGAVVVVPIATIAITLLVLALCRNLIAGRFFSSTATHIITAISLVIAGAWLLQLGCAVMTSNWALAQIADPAVADAAGRPFSYTPILVSMAVGALAAVFKAGERMQRDTEGLV
jgi:hypothetical protein